MTATGRHDRAGAWAAAAAGALALLVRWPFRTALPTSWDAVDFALALERFDLLAMQPHAPGYPVYVALGELVRLAVPDPIVALSTLSAICTGLAAVPLVRLAVQSGGPVAGAVTGALWAVQPLASAMGVLPLSDAPGLLAALLVLLAAAGPGPGAPWLAGALSGLLAGIRLSDWPASAATLWIVWRRGGRAGAARFAAGAGLAALPWLAFLVSQEGVAGLLGLTSAFAAGHFGDWGGTPWAEGEAWPRRLAFLLRVGIGEGLLGGPGPAAWPGAAALAILALAARDGRPATGRDRGHDAGSLLCLWGGISAAWLLLGQNPQSPRHLLPLAALLCIGAGTAAATALRRDGSPTKPRAAVALAAAALACSWAASSWRLLRAVGEAPPPVVALADDLARHGDPARSAVLTWEEERVIEYRHPEWTAVRVRSADYLRAVVWSLPAGTRIFVTSKVVEGLPPAERERLRPHLVPLGRYAGPGLVYGAYADLTLYALQGIP